MIVVDVDDDDDDNDNNNNNNNNQLFIHLNLRPGVLSLVCGAGKFDKIWCAYGQREIQYTEWRMAK